MLAKFKTIKKPYKGIPRDLLNKHLEIYEKDYEEHIETSSREQPTFEGQLPRCTKARLVLAPLISDIVQKMFHSGAPDAADATLDEMVSKADPKMRLPRGWVWKQRGAELFEAGDYPAARKAYLRAIREFLGKKDAYMLPCPTALNVEIQAVENEPFAEVTMCANNIAQCFTKELDQVSALEWIEEVHAMYDSWLDCRKAPGADLPWKDLYMCYEEFFTTRLKAFLRQREIYHALGNSAAALGATWEGWKFGVQSGNDREPRIRKLRDQFDAPSYSMTRHPDANQVEKIQLLNPGLQVRGVWKKLQVRVTKEFPTPPSRCGHAGFVWKSRYYVFGGEHGNGTEHRDGWVLDLAQLSPWRRVPGTGSGTMRNVLHHHFGIHNERAYLFQGRQTLPYFDLRTESWSQVTTKLADGKPWFTVCPGNNLVGYAAVVYKDKLYVFGGSDTVAYLGRNLLMALDLVTFTWEVLSGTVKTVPNVKIPGVRQHPAAWAADGKMYITLGDAHRTAALASKLEHGASSDYSYRDLWSWDMERNIWTHERFLGNPPSRRTEIGYTYNPAWGCALVFGGYDSTMPFVELSSNYMFEYSYYGETFVWSSETKSWSQVLTKGFPTYRAAPQLFTDESTGRTYLFGGYTNTQYTPSTRSTPARAFSDLWELQIDVPGASSDEADFVVDPRFTNLGPWKRCFACESVGRWKMCGGTCRLTEKPAYFCGKECLRAGWAQHKQENGCKKA